MISCFNAAMGIPKIVKMDQEIQVFTSHMK